MQGNFQDCLELVLKSEGGWVNHPSDPGGETNLGVTKRVWEEYVGHPVESLKKLTKDDVAVSIEEDILKISYTKPEEDENFHPGTIHRGLAKRSFDLGYKISAKYDLSKAVAQLENGLLEISIPISEKAKPKTLKIK
jgi:hypothetical protein